MSPIRRSETWFQNQGEEQAMSFEIGPNATKAYNEGYAAGKADGVISEWKPIASAPRDGTVVIGFDPNRDDDDGLPHGVDFMRRWNGCWIDPLTHNLQPTHWMPLPEPPKEEK